MQSLVQAALFRSAMALKLFKSFFNKAISCMSRAFNMMVVFVIVVIDFSFDTPIR